MQVLLAAGSICWLTTLLVRQEAVHGLQLVVQARKPALCEVRLPDMRILRARGTEYGGHTWVQIMTRTNLQLGTREIERDVLFEVTFSSLGFRVFRVFSLRV